MDELESTTTDIGPSLPETPAQFTILRKIRLDRNLSQVDVAKRAQLCQASISRTELTSAHRISTLRNYIHGLGGKLVLLARFPDTTYTLEEDEYYPGGRDR